MNQPAGANAPARSRPVSTARPWRQRLAEGLLAGLLVAGAAPPTAAQSTTPTLPPGFHESIVFAGLVNPMVVRFASNGQVFVAEKSGLIKVFDSLTDQTPTIFADLRTEVHNYWDRGLIGLELDPNYPAQPYVYVSYTYDFDPNTPTQIPRWGTPGADSDPCPSPPGPTTDGCVVMGRVSRLTASGTPTVMSAEQVLVQDWCQQFPSHSVGALRFGPEGALYASGGEGAGFTFVDYGQAGVPRNPCGDPPAGVGGTQTPPTAQGGALRSQDLRSAGDPVSLHGSVIRIDPGTGAAWPTNPLVGSSDANARRIIAHGLRNPFRFVRRPGTNELWIGDVGWNDWEEINVINDTTDAVVENFGWPCYEGSGRQSGFDAADLALCEALYGEPAAVTMPYYKYHKIDAVVPGENCPKGSSSISGLAFEFYPSGSYPPEYDNALFFADYSRNCIWAMFAGTAGRPNPGTLKTFVDGALGPVDIQIGPGGDLFYVDFNGGTIRRIQFLGTGRPPIAVASATPDSGPPPLTVQFSSAGSSDPDGGTLTYAWDLDGDGAFDDATSAAPSTTYTTPGTRVVSLKVTDSGGASSTTTVTVTVQGTNLALNRPVTASSSYGAGYEANKAVDGLGTTRWSSQFSDPQWLMVDLGNTYALTGLTLAWEAAYGKAYRIEVSTDAVTWTTIYSTTTGDGGVDDLSGLSGTGRYVRVFGTVRGYPAAGYSLWELEVYGVVTSNRPPTAVAIASPTSGAPPLTVQFDGRGSSDPDGDPITFAWDLDGDGAFDDSTSATPSTTYSTPGTRVVSLKVTDSGGASSTTTVTVTVQGTNLALNRPVTASSFYGAGYEADKAVDGLGTTRWSSQFSDPQWLMVDLGNTYAVTGVKLAWETAYGKAYRIEVSTDAVTWTTIYSTTTSDGGVDDIGGLSGTGRYVRVFGTVRGYPSAGYSLWELEIYGVVTSNRPPTAVATASPTGGAPPLTVQFDGRGSSDPDGDPITFAWDLDGDGAFDDSTSATPSTTYTTPGTRVVSLKVTDSGGASSTTTVTVTVQGTNLALNRPVTASSSYGAGYEADKAVDGSGSTRWSSQFSDPQWLMVDLGNTYAVNGVKLAWETAYGKAYRIEVSTDAVTWTTIYSTTTSDGGVDDIGGLSGTGRYVRVFGTVRGYPAGYSLWELEVYGAAPSDRPPVPVISAPGGTVTWRVGEAISFAGSATDPEDGTLPATALSWSLVLQHCPSNCHSHLLQSWPGVASGSFTAPDHDYPSYLELTLTATDSRGATGSSKVRLDPKTVTLGFQTSPTGLQLVVGATTATAPFNRTVILGSANSISAPSPQTLSTGAYGFVAWSDGGAQTHNIVANSAATYTATFASTGDTTAPLVSNVRARSITSSAATISWSTNEAATSQVEYGTTTAYGSVTPLDPALVTSHSVRLTGLASKTLYHYRVRSRDAQGNVTVSGDFTFQTR